MRRTSLHVLSPILALSVAACAPKPAPAPDLAGMWSDPPATALDTFCFFFCEDSGLAYLEALLDDPANDARPYRELSAEADKHQTEHYFRPRFTEAALATSPLTEDRGFLYCEPWGFVLQVFAPHQLEIRQYPDRVEMRYGEWEARRTVYLDGRAVPEDQAPSVLGYAVGRYEGDTLVVETSRVAANDTVWDTRHSDQLTAVERYRRPAHERLELAITIADPWGLREPVELKKVWSFAPEQEIYPYDSCVPQAKIPPEGNAP